MAIKKTYTEYLRPAKWSSAHQPIQFKFDMPTENCIIFNHASEGFLTLWIADDFMDNPDLLLIGDIVYIKSGPYLGFHVLKKRTHPTLQIWQTETPYTVSTGSTVFEVKYASPQEFKICKGWQTGEVLINTKPFKVIAEAQFESDKDGYLSANIMGYIKSIFSTSPPTINPITYNQELYWPYRILTPDSFEFVYYALNSAIDSMVLNAEYLDTNKPLNSFPIITDCGTTILTYLKNNGVVSYQFNGTLTPQRNTFSDRFSDRFLKN